MGVVLGYLLIFVAGILAIVFALIAARLREDIYFILGCIFTGIVIIYILWNFKWWWLMLTSAGGAFTALLIASFVVLPCIFLIQSKQKKGFGNNSDPEVTVDYLDSVIEGDEEEIDFEDNFNEDYEISDDDFESL